MRGTGSGACLLPLRLDQPPAEAEPLLDALVAEERICAARILEVDQEGSSVPTGEKALRSGDRSFPGLLLIEATGGAAYGLRDTTTVGDIIDEVQKQEATALRGEAQVVWTDTPNLWIAVLSVLALGFVVLVWRVRL